LSAWRYDVEIIVETVLTKPNKLIQLWSC